MKCVKAQFSQSMLGCWGMTGMELTMDSGSREFLGNKKGVEGNSRTIPKGCRIIGVKGRIFNHEIRNLSFVLWSPPESSLTESEHQTYIKQVEKME